MGNTNALMEAMRQFVVEATIRDIRKDEPVMRQSGLQLSDREIAEPAQKRVFSMQTYKQMDWAESILPALIFWLSDSPYVSQSNFAQVLGDLQDVYYAFKSEPDDILTDEELTSAIIDIFNNTAQGDVGVFSGMEAGTLRMLADVKT